MKRFLIPLGIFIVLVIFLGIGLKLNPREVPSPLIGKPAPDFKLALLSDPSRQMSPADLHGKVWLFNVWASWCGSCRQEHDLLLGLARQGIVPIYGMDYKDQPGDARAVLTRFGNPYVETVIDPDGRTGINYGVYGVPETYLIDKGGIIRYKHTGPLTQEILDKKILPLAKELQL
ncbi:MAG: DsbE family thiol:disulfide interchange protein [Sulfurimicrobium sp.]|jgi:cytochrome c biogenesis protein CcmG/thiol:disulfide interchange protein DsbE|nr:DsbE family thiol:disulfide interchange protein [Sulfurimicrobium sp.]MDP2961934.1 DsbE family thiol:disulfide interchange protein [Sulfurimicrobium sp.]MDZ7654840.1 DsbE family thiol:disulfide interchange protein [Sulfurimicrobium sp.]